jgi:hypothetical protein
MADLESTAVRPDVTDVRFSMRSMLMFTALVAVLAAALGAFVRRFPAAAQPRLWVFWGILAALLIALALVHACLRYRAEKEGGRVLFQLVPHSYFFPRAPRLATILVGAFFTAAAPVTWVAESFIIGMANPKLWSEVLNWGTIASVFASGLGISYFWWHRRIRLGENGILVRHNFVPWEECRRWYWDACYRDVVVMEFESRGRIAARVPADECAMVERVLQDTLGTASRSRR